MYNKVLTVKGWKRRNSAFSLGCQKLYAKSVSVPRCTKGCPTPVFRNSTEVLINVLKCLLDEKQYYEDWGPLLLLDAIPGRNKVCSRHNFSFPEAAHFLDPRVAGQGQFLAGSSLMSLPLQGKARYHCPIASALRLVKVAPWYLLLWCRLIGEIFTDAEIRPSATYRSVAVGATVGSLSSGPLPNPRTTHLVLVCGFRKLCA